MKIKQRYSITSILILALFSSSTAFCHLPDLGSEYRSTLSVQDEKIIGDSWIKQLRGAGMMYHDPLAHEYVQHLGNRLTPFVEMPYSDIRIKFFAVNDTSVNAFAFFGGHIAVHSGLILLTQSESELAGVISHELAHISQQHSLRQITEQKRMMPIAVAQSLAAIVLGMPDLIIPVLAGHQQHMLNFSRQYEQEADRVGMQILAQAKFDPQGLPDILERMSLSSRYQNKPPEYLLTHPLYESRISDTRHRASIYIYKPNLSSHMFHLIKTRLQIQNSTNLHQLIKDYKQQLQKQRYNNVLATSYGYAYALQQAGKPKEAWQAISSLITEYPEDLIIQMTAASIEFDLQNYTAAQNRLDKLLHIHPDSYSLAIQNIELKISTKQPQVAKKLLATYKTMHPIEPIYYELARNIESMLGNQTGVYQANAEWYVLNGDITSATTQLSMALELTGNDQQTISKIKARIAELDRLKDKLKTI